MLLFWSLITVHLLYDFHWQGPFISEAKGKYNFILAVHALTWTLLLCGVLYYFHHFAPWMMVFLFVSHAVTDYWKSHQPKDEAHFWLIYVDQGLHLLQILLVFFWRL